MVEKTERGVPRQRIAVVGGGLAGLVACHRFSQAAFDVVLVEKQSQSGFDLHRVDLSQIACNALRNGPRPPGQKTTKLGVIGGQTSQFIDIPLRVLNRKHWPQLAWLYDSLGVCVTEVDPSQSYSESGKRTYFRTSAEGLPVSRSLSWLFQPVARSIVRDAARLRRHVDREPGILESGDMSLDHFLRTHRYSPDFIRGLLYPLLSSTVCSCTYQALNEYPANLILRILSDLLDRSADGHLLRTELGSADVTRRLLGSGIKVRGNTEVVQLQVNDGHVALESRTSTGNLERQWFDHVIVATPPECATRILGVNMLAERKMLACFDEQRATVVVHSDCRLMPPNRRQWSTFNVITDRRPKISTAAMCSIWINRYLGLPAGFIDLFQTINPLWPPEDQLTYCQVQLPRVTVNSGTSRGWSQLDRLHQDPHRRVWFAGSYAVPGVPLLETAVASSHKVFNAVLEQGHCSRIERDPVVIDSTNNK